MNLTEIGFYDIIIPPPATPSYCYVTLIHWSKYKSFLLFPFSQIFRLHATFLVTRPYTPPSPILTLSPAYPMRLQHPTVTTAKEVSRFLTT